ncbi:MAG: PhoH family protein [Candidatus Lernaella stagnicola]|nr:PhoH family protein [Candidatus Lernaella stagnicola]
MAHDETTNQNDTPAIFFPDAEAIRQLVGQGDENLRAVENALGVKLSVRGDRIFVRGPREHFPLIKQLFEELYGLVSEGFPVYATDVEHALDILRSGQGVKLRDVFLDTVFISQKKRTITPKSIHQKQYIDAIRAHDIVFGIGPAGTGKTYLAMAMAVSHLVKGEVDRIILVRPAVEAGEKLGFLPGDIVEKVNPYLRPLYDALNEMMPFEKVQSLIERQTIEVAPLAFMRGRTLNDSFVVLDEAQNCTPEQMKMFLTRLGFQSKAVITGDDTQIDLPPGQESGLVVIQDILAGMDGVIFVRFDDTDVVRHRLVQQIILAYDRYEREKRERKAENGSANGGK